MSKFNTLITKLREVFQIDRPDLDFGIYRIMNARAGEINKYLENDLKKKVEEALLTGETTDYQEVENELKDALKNAHALGADPDVLPVVQDLRKKLASLSAGDSEHEDTVFSHLLTFFSRYYENGDYISQRRYKGDTYAIPYAGEEVMLHWANKDQYYIKSGEAFTNYNFKLDDGRVVRFRLVSADTAKDNRKDNDEDRCFALISNDHTITKTDEAGESYTETIKPIVSDTENGELILHFTYQSYPKKVKQKDLTAKSLKTILSDKAIAKDWLAIHAKKPTEKNPTRTILEYHLTTYTAKNSADYFIHKDLGTFLRNELDFYIKNEVMHLDDIQSAEKFADIETSLRMIQCLRSIALDLIRFVAQLEDFQKKLWLKKKCVTDTNYIITLDRVPQTLYPAILENKAQHKEWQQLGFIEKLSEITEKHLKSHQSLSIDTKHFDEAFTAELLFSIENFDEQCDGLLLHSENFQALNLLQERYREKVKCVYIDPPYNTDNDTDFYYKDAYRRSSWSSMIFDRYLLSKNLLTSDGSLFSQIDDFEEHTMRILLDSIFTEGNRINRIAWVRTFNSGSSKGLSKKLPSNLDLIFWYGKTKDYAHVKQFRPYSVGAMKRYDKEDEKGNRFKWNPMKTYSEEKLARLIKTGDAMWTENSKYPVYRKFLDLNSGAPMDNNWFDVSPIGTQSSERTGFPTQKPIKLIERCLKLTGDGIIFDFFAGSGTTGHAVINLLRDKKTDRDVKYMLCEMGAHFDTVLIPRLKKVVYSSEWKDGKPVSIKKKELGIKNSGSGSGISHCIKYLRLESYEDTLNNLILPKDSSELLSGSVREDYLLGYMLDVETQGSLLNVTHFKKPFSYQLDIATDSAGATEKKSIDLVETFNYLTGITIKHIDRQLERGFISITGTLPNGESCCILWRDCEKVDYTELNKICQKLKLTAKDDEYEVIYVNGDHNIPNIVEQTESEGGKVSQLKLRQTETTFLEKMFN